MTRQLLTDSIYCSICEGIRNDYYDNDLDGAAVYIDSAFRHYPNDQVWGPENRQYELKISAEKNDTLTIYTLYFGALDKSQKYFMPKSHLFEFVKVNGKFKLYGMVSHG